MEIKLLKPITVDGNKIEKINLKLEDLTGSEILKADMELRKEGEVMGITNLNDQKVLLKIASKSSGVLEDDLKKLSAPDFFEVTFTVRNFLFGSSVNQEEQENLE